MGRSLHQGMLTLYERPQVTMSRIQGTCIVMGRLADGQVARQNVASFCRICTVWISKIDYTQGSISDYDEIFWVWTCWYFEYLNDHGNYWPTQHLWLWALDTKRPRGVLTLIHRRTKCRSEKRKQLYTSCGRGTYFLHHLEFSICYNLDQICCGIMMWPLRRYYRL